MKRLGIPRHYRATEHFIVPRGHLARRMVSAAAVCIVAVGAQSAGAGDLEPAPLPAVQVNYLEHCGGCHGIQGNSAPREVPRLRGLAGYFLCLPEARAYLARLPSVATSPLSDEEVASLLNFVVFDLGGASTNRDVSTPYTSKEVGVLRQQPLNEISLAGYREVIVSRLIEQCGAPTSLRDYVSARSGQ